MSGLRLVCLVVAAGVSASTVPRSKGGANNDATAVRLLLSEATGITPRSLEDNNNGINLGSYSLEFQDCHSTAQWNGDEDNGNDGSAKVVTKRLARFRLCPSEYCSAESDGQCSGGTYGEYILDLGTFVEAWMQNSNNNDNNNEDENDNDNENEAFDPAEYAYCAQYDDDGYYYVGPVCTEGSDEFGVGVGFGVFVDDACSIPASDGTTLAGMTGYTLPYSDGTSLLQDDVCTSCNANGNNGNDNDNDNNNNNNNAQASEMCQEVYESAGKCETDMDMAYPNENGCDYIARLTALSTNGSSGGEEGMSRGLVIGLIAFAVVVSLLAGGYVCYLKKKLGRASINLNDGGGGTMA